MDIHNYNIIVKWTYFKCVDVSVAVYYGVRGVSRGARDSAHHKVVSSGHRAALTESPLGSMTASLFPAHNYCAMCNLVCVIIMLLCIYMIHLYCNMYILWNFIHKKLIRFTLHF